MGQFERIISHYPDKTEKLWEKIVSAVSLTVAIVAIILIGYLFQ